jgi:hypothetical protein
MGIDELDDLEAPSRPRASGLSSLYPFTSWKYSPETCYYADEASLYSIPENSRGEAASELTSRPPSVSGSDIPGVWDKEQETVIVEMPWLSFDESEKRSNVSTQEGSFGDERDTADLKYAEALKSRKRKHLWSVICILFFLILAVSLGVALTRSHRGKHATNVSTQELKSETLVSNNATTQHPTAMANENAPAAIFNPTPLPTQLPVTTQTPTSLSTKAPTQDFGTLLVSNYILQALSSCADRSELTNVTTIQGKIFSVLQAEVLAQVMVYPDGSIDIPYSCGMGMIAERFGLMMLYEMTNGDQWKNNSLWESTGDVCLWHGVDACSARSSGSCAVRSLQLGKSKLLLTRVQYPCLPIAQLELFCL